MATITCTTTSTYFGLPYNTTTYTVPYDPNYIYTFTPRCVPTATTTVPHQCLTTLMHENALLKAELAALKQTFLSVPGYLPKVDLSVNDRRVEVGVCPLA
jgi:hypothetical protein